MTYFRNDGEEVGCLLVISNGALARIAASSLPKMSRWVNW